MSHQQQQEETAEALSGRPLLLHDIGQKLTQAREAKGETLNKPVNKLKIPINHMQALESGNWDAMPDDVYVIGFLRQYSAYLELDLSDEINRLKNSEYTLTRPLTFPDPPVAPSRRWAWLTGTAFILLFIVFNVIDFKHSDENTAPVSHSPEQPSSQHELTASEQNASKQAAPKQLSATLSSIEEKSTPTVSTNIVTSETVTAPPKPSRATQVPASPRFNPAKQAIKPVTHTFRFEAVTAPVWIQIFLPNQAGDGKGRLLKEMLLKKGQFSNIRRATESLWITCGNALALRIKVDRKTVIDTGELGAGKKVLRDYHFKISD